MIVTVLLLIKTQINPILPVMRIHASIARITQVLTTQDRLIEETQTIYQNPLDRNQKGSSSRIQLILLVGVEIGIRNHDQPEGRLLVMVHASHRQRLN